MLLTIMQQHEMLLWWQLWMVESTLAWTSFMREWAKYW